MATDSVHKPVFTRYGIIPYYRFEQPETPGSFYYRNETDNAEGFDLDDGFPVWSVVAWFDDGIFMTIGDHESEDEAQAVLEFLESREARCSTKSAV